MIKNKRAGIGPAGVLAVLVMIILGSVIAIGLMGGGTAPRNPVVNDADYYAEGTITFNVKDNRGQSALSNIDTIEWYPHGTSFKDCAAGTVEPEHTASSVSTSTDWYIDSENGGPLPVGNDKLYKTVWVEEGTSPVYTYYPGPYDVSIPGIPKTSSARTATASDLMLDDVGTLTVSATAQVPGQSASTSAIALDASNGNEYVDVTIAIQQSESDSVLKNLRLYVYENSSTCDSSDVADPSAYNNLKSLSVTSKSGGVGELKQEPQGTDGGLSTSYDIYYMDLPDLEYDNSIPDSITIKLRLVMDAGTTGDPTETLGLHIVAAGWDAQNYSWTEFNDDSRDYYESQTYLTID